MIPMAFIPFKNNPRQGLRGFPLTAVETTASCRLRTSVFVYVFVWAVHASVYICACVLHSHMEVES